MAIVVSYLLSIWLASSVGGKQIDPDSNGSVRRDAEVSRSEPVTFLAYVDSKRQRPEVTVVDKTIRETVNRLINGFEDGVPFYVYNYRNAEYGGPGSAIESLQEIGADAVPYLVQRLESQNRDVRFGCVVTLGRIGHEARIAGPALTTRLLQDSDSQIRLYAAKAIGELRYATPDAIQCLCQALQDPKSNVRGVVARELGSIGGDSAAAVGALSAAMADDDSWVRTNAAEALGEIGRAASPAVGSLIEALTSDAEKEYLGRDELESLNGAPSEESSEEEREQTEKNLRYILRLFERQAAVRALGQIGPQAKDSLGLLFDLLETDDHVMIGDLVEAIRQIDPDSDAIVSATAKVLKSGDSSARHSAAVAIQQMGPDARGALPIVERAVLDREGGVRIQAALAYVAITSQSKDMVPVLVAALSDSQRHVRYSAVRALTTIGAEGNAVAQALQKLVDDIKEDDGVRTAAREALRAVRLR